MALQIFETDPDAKPKPKATYEREDVAFQLRSGMQVRNESTKKMEPVSLNNWRVLTGDPDVASGIAELMGGSPDEYDQTKDMHLQVLTTSPAVEIVIDGSAAIEDKLILWGPAGPLHECDGAAFLSPAEERGNPCGCPPLLSQRKALARSRRGPAPAINIKLRLAGVGYDLGPGKLIATAWSLAEVIYQTKDALDEIDGEALCRLELEHVEYTNKQGIDVSFNKPVITVLGSYNDAIAQDR